MQLSAACTAILDQLTDVIHQLDEGDYTRSSTALGKSTIGQHTRHTLEFFLCLEEGFHRGIVNYDNRAHDKIIESDKFMALHAILQIRFFINCQAKDRPLKLEAGYDLSHEAYVTIDTNFYRELTYNIEHAVHHMAIMKIGLREVAPYVICPPHFGVAASTVRHREHVSASH